MPKLTRDECILEMCKITALAYRSIGDYSRASDGYCSECPHSHSPETFRNEGHIIDYVRQAVVEKLERDGHKIAPGFDPVTGRELCPS